MAAARAPAIDPAVDGMALPERLRFAAALIEHAALRGGEVYRARAVAIVERVVVEMRAETPRGKR